MSIAATEVQKAYLAYFGRPADSVGLTYWMGSDAATMKAGFAASNEYVWLYVGMSVEQRVEQVYQNLLGRPSDVVGKTYWVAEINAGRETVGLLAASMQANALGGDIATIANRVAYATDFTAALDTTTEITGYAGTAVANAARAVMTQITTDASLATARAALTASVASVVAAGTTGGIVADGYIHGATVFADANNDGIWNIGEAKTTTDDKGGYTMSGATGRLIASGGTDISTNQDFKGILKAPDGATVVNPLTTLLQGFVEKDQTIAEAEATVAKALGFDASEIDLQHYDPLAAALDANASAADKSFALGLQADAAKVANLLVTASQTLIGAAGGSDKLSEADAANALIESLVNRIEQDADGVISFTDSALLQDMLTESVALAGDADLTAAMTKVEDMAENFATMMADSAQKVDEIEALGGDITTLVAKISQVQTVTQGDMADQMLAAAETGDLAGMLDDFTGTAFDSAVTAADIGDLDPNSSDDDAIVDDVNAGDGTPPPPDDGGGAPPATTFTVTEDGTTHAITFGGTATGAVTLTTDGTNLTFTRGGIEATTTPAIATVAAGGVPAVTLTAATFATAGLAGLLADASATIDATDASAVDLATVNTGIAKVAAGGITNLTALALDDPDITDEATSGLLGKATDATVVATGATATEVGYLVINIANIAADGISGDLALTSNVTDTGIAALFGEYSGTTATVDATGMDATQLVAVAAGVANGYFAAGNISGALALTSDVTDIEIAALFSVYGDTAATVDAADMDAAQLAAVAAGVANSYFDGGGISGALALTSFVAAADIAALFSVYVDTAATVDAAGMDADQLAAVAVGADNGYFDDGGISGDLALTSAVAAAVIAALFSVYVDTATTVDAAGMDADQLAAVAAGAASGYFVDGGISGALALTSFVAAADIAALFSVYGGATATVDATGMDADQLAAVAAGAASGYIAADGISGDLALTSFVTAADITALFSVYGDIAATVDATGMDATQLAAVAAGVAYIAAGDISGVLALTSAVAAADIAALFTVYGGGAATVNATGMDATQLAAVAAGVATVANDGITGTLALSTTDLTDIEIAALLGAQTNATATVSVNATGMDAGELAAVGAGIAKVDSLTIDSTHGVTVAAADITGNILTVTGTTAATDILTVNGTAGNDPIDLGNVSLTNASALVAGGDGADIMTGGAGADVFAYTDSASQIVTYGGADTDATNIEKITNFVAGTDYFHFVPGSVFASLTLDTTTGVSVNKSAAGVSYGIGGAPIAVTSTATTLTLLTAEMQAAAPAAVSTTGVAGNATGLQIYTFAVTGGAFDGKKFMVINDATAAIAATDVIIEITGVTGNISAADFAPFAPTADADIPITGVDSDSAGGYTAGDIITLKFSEAVATATITTGNLVLSANSLGGAGLAVTALNASGGYASEYAIELGAAPTVVATDTITVAAANVVDTDGNHPLGTVVFTVPTAVTILRADAGASTKTGADGVNDVFVAVGVTAAGQYTGSDANFTVLTTINNNADSEVDSGDVFAGGTGYDTLHIYGTADLTGVTLTGIERVVLHSDVTFTAAQINALNTAGAAIVGDGASTLRLGDAGGATNVDLTNLDLSNIGQLDVGNNITAIASQANIDAVAAISSEAVDSANSAALTATTVAELAIKLQAAVGYADLPFTLVDSGNDIVITWKANGAVTPLSYVTKTVDGTKFTAVETQAGGAGLPEIQTIAVDPGNLSLTGFTVAEYDATSGLKAGGGSATLDISGKNVFGDMPVLEATGATKYAALDAATGVASVGTVIATVNALLRAIDTSSGVFLTAMLGAGGKATLLAPAEAPNYELSLGKFDIANILLGRSGVQNFMAGGAGSDTIYGGADQTNFIYGGANEDGADTNSVTGGGARDFLAGGDGADTIHGGSGSDFVASLVGNDILYGENDTDLLDGGEGNDIVVGGAGIDFLQGGNGNDKIVFTETATQDYLLDFAGAGTALGSFDVNAELLVFDVSVFTGLTGAGGSPTIGAPVALATDVVFAGTTAEFGALGGGTAAVRLWLNTDGFGGGASTLMYDQDGNWAAGSVAVVTLLGVSTLDAGDIGVY